MSTNVIHKWIVAGTLLCVLSVFINPVWAIKVKQCTPPAEKSIKQAYKFVTRNLDGMVADMTWRNMTDRHRDEFKRKWDRLKAKCVDDRRKCINHSDRLGYAHGGIGNTVNICYFNMVELNSTFCNLVGILVHEKAHADGMPKGNHHNEPNVYPDAFNDTVYRMGYAAEGYCETRKKGNKNYMLQGRSGLVIGKQCSKNDQCQSGRCGNIKYTCLCRVDSDCGAGKRCKKVTGQCKSN